jgi:hypothetical protein
MSLNTPKEIAHTCVDLRMAYQTSKSDLSLASSVTKFVAMICMSLNTPKAAAHACQA